MVSRESYGVQEASSRAPEQIGRLVWEKTGDSIAPKTIVPVAKERVRARKRVRPEFREAS